MDVVFFVGALVVAYLIGSIPFGYVVARLAGVEDIRQHGSGNIGATNVLRTVGSSAAVLVLVLDALKGAIGVFLVRLVGGGPEWQALGGLAAMTGHMWPFTLGFRGGKGVATGIGMLAALDPIAALVAGVVFVLVVATTRYVSLGSISATVPALLALWLRGATPAETTLAAVGAVLIIWRHAPNIRRLLAGTENKFSGFQSQKESITAPRVRTRHP